MDDIALRIRHMRLKAGLGVREVARTMGVSHPTITSWETGKTEPSIGNLASFAAAVGMELPAFFKAKVPTIPPGMCVVCGVRRPARPLAEDEPTGDAA